MIFLIMHHLPGATVRVEVEHWDLIRVKGLGFRASALGVLGGVESWVQGFKVYPPPD